MTDKPVWLLALEVATVIAVATAVHLVLVFDPRRIHARATR